VREEIAEAEALIALLRHAAGADPEVDAAMAEAVVDDVLDNLQRRLGLADLPWPDADLLPASAPPSVGLERPEPTQ
jgi:hypothetical protein